MSKLVAGNWKMHGLAAEVAALAHLLVSGAGRIDPERAALLVCPPFTAVASVGAILNGSTIALGGQDCHPFPAGPHTGDISAPMLRDLGARYVILGHSERRAGHGESDALVRAKAVAAAAAGLIPIVCVGESLAQREAGRDAEAVSAQLSGSLPDDFASPASSGIVAYEPVWAIGTGRTPTSAQVTSMHALIRACLATRFGPPGRTLAILYGGSVKPENAAAILSLPDVGGALVGGASLVAANFLAIAAAA
ncbi:MAG: triose-phosphate isomerase [Rhodospirillales bacterium]|nr:triose-phosphate isomerase [Rhodospirillales bacterium]